MIRVPFAAIASAVGLAALAADPAVLAAPASQGFKVESPRETRAGGSAASAPLADRRPGALPSTAPNSFERDTVSAVPGPSSSLLLLSASLAAIGVATWRRLRN